MAETPITTIIISSFLALAGFTVFFVGFVKGERWSKIIGGSFFIAGIVSLFVNDEDFRQIVTAAAGVIAAVAAAFALQQNTQLRRDAKEAETRDKNERKLKEVRDWVFEIKNTTLEPITEGNMAFRQENILLEYGKAFNRVEYFMKVILKLFKDDDFEKKVKNLAEMLIAVIVLSKVEYLKYKLNDQDFKAFIGYEDFRDNLLSEYDNMLAELKNKNKDGIESRLIDLTNQQLHKKYTIELNNSESTLLSKLTDIESSLL